MSRFMCNRLSAAGLIALLGISAVSAQDFESSTESVDDDSSLAISLDAADVQRSPAPDDATLANPAVPPVIDFAVGDADDPPALLAKDQLGSMKSLAQRLSSDSAWLRPEILRALGHQELRLDEIFVRAPEAIRVGDTSYRVQVEASGITSADFDPATDAYYVFLSHEIFDGLGDDRALAFVDGKQVQIFEHDLETSAAFALTLADISEHEAFAKNANVTSITGPIELGAAELRLTLERLPVHLYPELHAVARLGDRFSLNDLAQFAADLRQKAAAPASISATAASTSCIQEVAPLSCSGGKPVCTAGYAPYFVMSNIKIKQDHEGAFKGNPEIELFPMRIDIASPTGSNTTARTDFWFYGRNMTDMAGRTRYLPDVNNTNTWYTITNGVAIFPVDKGFEFSAMLVEQDDDRGVLRVKSTKINVTKVFDRVNNIVSYITDSRSIDLNFLVELGKLILDIIGLFNDGDDIYQESIGFSNNLFCSDSVGQMKTYTFASQEWEMKGHFACINPSCPNPGSGGGGGGGGGGFPFPDCLSISPEVDCR